MLITEQDGEVSAEDNDKQCTYKRNIEARSRNHCCSGNYLLLLEALQLQRSFGLLNEFLPFGPVSDAVLPVCYFHPCYIALYIILPSIFRSS